MKQTITNVIMVIALILLSTACQREECPCNKEKRKNNNQTLTVTSGITGLRAYNNTWSANDAIGIFSSTLQSENVRFTTTSEGENATFTTATPITIPYSTTATHTVTAYYPYSTAATTSNGVVVSIPTATPLLFAQGSVTTAQPHLNLLFSHQLAEVKITIDATALNADQLQSVKLKEVNNQATLNVATGKVTATGTPSEATLLPRESESNAPIFVYHTFIAPGENLTGKELIVEVTNRAYTIALKQGDKTDNALAGYRYEYTYTLTSGDQILGSTEVASITTPTVVPINGGFVDPNGTAPSSTAIKYDMFPNGLQHTDLSLISPQKKLKTDLHIEKGKTTRLLIQRSPKSSNTDVVRLKSHLEKMPKTISFQLGGICEGMNIRGYNNKYIQVFNEASTPNTIKITASETANYSKSISKPTDWALVEIDLSKVGFRPGLKNDDFLFEFHFKEGSKVNLEMIKFKVTY